MQGYINSNKEVRDAGFKLIMLVYRFIGDSVRNYFRDLRQPQINALEEGFENEDGQGHIEDMDKHNEFMNESKLIFDKNEGNNNKNAQNKNKIEKTNYNDYDEQPINNNINNNFNENMNSQALSQGI